RDGRVRVVVATTVLLSFISFWRAAAIVLADLGSTAFYVGGIVEQAVGKSAPWFILGVMIFSYAVRALYIESSAMFVRGGVYRVVKEAMGGTLAKLSVSALLFGFGHSILAMSGEESLAQVYREIEVPKVKNLQRAGMVIFIYSLVFTGLVSFFAVAIIPDSVRPQYYDNLISGLAMHVIGPVSLRLVFQAVVVVVGFLMLAGAVNTAIV